MLYSAENKRTVDLKNLQLLGNDPLSHDQQACMTYLTMISELGEILLTVIHLFVQLSVYHITVYNHVQWFFECWPKSSYVTIGGSTKIYKDQSRNKFKLAPTRSTSLSLPSATKKGTMQRPWALSIKDSDLAIYPLQCT